MFGGWSAPPTENLNDFPPAGEAGGKIIDDFLNDFPLAKEAEKIINDLLNDFPPAGRLAERGGSGEAPPSPDSLS